jgi:hypothetical protein
MNRRELLIVLTTGGCAASASPLQAGEKTSAAPVKPTSARLQGISLNEDDSHFFADKKRHDLDAAQVDAWVDQYADTQVRELMICPNAMRTSFDSKVWTPIWKGFDPQAGPDQPLFASYPPEERKGPYHFVYNAWKLNQDGIDVYARWIRRARQRGIAPWLSMRMNDIHNVDDEGNYLHSDFWKQNPQFRRVNYRFAEWTDRALDYGQPEVRQYNLALVRELVERYDLDGLELDWMRFGYHFRPGHEQEGSRILTEFTAEVRRVLDTWEKRRGHRILLGARVPSRPQTAVGLGMDAITWAQRGLVNMIVVTPFWASIEPDMPIELWKQLLKGTGVILAAGLEVLVRPDYAFPPLLNSLETVRGAAATLLDRGADRLYLFNYMDSDTALADLENYPTLLREVGSLKTLAGKERRHIITFSDTWAPGEPRARVLPAKCVPGEWTAFRVPTGPRPTSERTTARLGIRGTSEDQVKTWKVRVNGEPCPYAGLVKPKYSRPEDPMFQFAVPLRSMNRGYNLIELSPKAEAEVIWVEVAISPASTA